MSTDASIDEPSPWPHRWSVLLACSTFPLLWVGQLITTTDAGMAVPDWPGTYGYNMFAYPWQTWFFGPWDLFIEHGHRLLASLVGLLAIGLLVVVWRSGARAAVRWLSVAALGLVIFQGVLGGARVIANERLIAMAHGCTGPLFFALTCVTVVATAKRRSHEADANHPDPTLRRLGPIATFTGVLVFFQLVLGASLRHIDASVGPWSFAALVKFHLLMAAVVLVHTLVVVGVVFRLRRPRPALRWIAGLVGLLVSVQIGLGVATWLVKYGRPGGLLGDWAANWLPATMEANVAGGLGQTHTVTGHSAVGSLLLGLMAAVAAIAWRETRPVSDNP